MNRQGKQKLALLLALCAFALGEEEEAAPGRRQLRLGSSV